MEWPWGFFSRRRTARLSGIITSANFTTLVIFFGILPIHVQLTLVQWIHLKKLNIGISKENFNNATVNVKSVLLYMNRQYRQKTHTETAKYSHVPDVMTWPRPRVSRLLLSFMNGGVSRCSQAAAGRWAPQLWLAPLLDFQWWCLKRGELISPRVVEFCFLLPLIQPQIISLTSNLPVSASWKNTLLVQSPFPAEQMEAQKDNGPTQFSSAQDRLLTFIE